MAYLLDANVFIAAKNQYYGFDICPGFWDWLTWKNQEGAVYSVESVWNELRAADDELSTWASERGADFFLRPVADVFPCFNEVSDWANSQTYDQAAVNTFLQAADYFLVAQAKAWGHTVVTLEISRQSQKRIKIPNACVGLGVPYMTPFQMLRIERARFVLSTPG